MNLTYSKGQDYNRITARNYARKYTCNLSGQNPKYYNPKYPYYSSDCANYVSQCIHEGGINEDNNWCVGSNTWIRTGHYSNKYGVTDYVVDKGLFFATSDRYKAFAGSIISWTSFSHVGLVDQNDTVTMTYCAHTNDRLSMSFRNSSNITFFVPEWDSYSGDWTR